MINWKQIFKLLGKLLLYIEAGMLLISLAVSLIYSEDPMPFVWTASLAIALGFTALYFCRNAKDNFSRKDGYLVVSLVWIVFTLIGMLPFIISGSISDVAGAFFETMSGFTSTGATVVSDIDAMPHGILFWRSMTQWIGGIGIIFFTLAIFPAFGAGEVKLFAAEATGPLHDKIHPRISVAVKWIGTVYLGLTVICMACLMLLNMGWFDAINISMTTAATGGFAPHTKLFHDQYSSCAIEYVVAAFMLFSGMNYTLLYYTFLKGKFKKFFSDPELKCYLIIALGSTLICTVVLVMGHGIDSLEQSFRNSLFTIVSIQTTTGFANCDYNDATIWPPVLIPFILLVMFAGACSGSTSGGFKCIRLSMLWRVLKGEFLRILHPRAVLPMKLNDSVVPTSVQRTLLAFITLLVLSLLVGTCLLIVFGLDTLNACSVALSAISNVGPTVNHFGPVTSYAELSDAAKLVCSFLMLIGRLEIFPIFILFTKGFWIKN